GISRKTFDSVDDPTGTDWAWPTTLFFRAELSTPLIAPVVTEPGATALVAPTWENGKRSITPIAKMSIARYFICSGCLFMTFNILSNLQSFKTWAMRYAWPHQGVT